MALTDLFDLFKKPEATSVELKAALADAQVQLVEAEDALDALEKSRRPLLLSKDGDSKVAALDGEISKARRAVDRIEVMIEELGSKIGDAEKRETAVEVDACAVRMRETARKMRDLSLGIHEHLLALNELVLEGQSLTRDLKSGNAFLIKNGRGDLKVDHPIGKAAQSIGRPVESCPPYMYFNFPIYGHPDSSLIAKAIRELKI